MTDIKNGDRVRVTFEGTWDDENGPGVALTDGVKLYEGYTLDAAQSVEKIEPPVEVFKPGDVVRRKGRPNHVYTIGNDGYLCHDSGTWVPYGVEFLSTHYEKVNLAES